jgi:hypothetical protein
MRLIWQNYTFSRLRYSEMKRKLLLYLMSLKPGVVLHCQGDIKQHFVCSQLFKRRRKIFLYLKKVKSKISFTTVALRARICKRLRSPGTASLPGGPVHQIGLSYRPSPGRESIPGLLKRFTNSGSALKGKEKVTLY